jgi:hypothetical protein
MSQEQEIFDWQQHTILTRDDAWNSYIVIHNGYAYHVPNFGGWAEGGNEAILWPNVHAYVQDHPEQIQSEPPPPEPSGDETVKIELVQVDKELK